MRMWRSRTYLLALLTLLSLFLAFPSWGTERNKIIDGDGVLRFCTDRSAFLQDRGRGFVEAPDRATGALAGTRVYVQGYVWEFRGLRAPRNVFVAFVQDRLVAIVWEWIFSGVFKPGRRAYEALKEYVLNLYDLKGEGGWRVVFAQKIEAWFTLQDELGNRIRIEGESNIWTEEDIFRAYFFLRGFSPQSGGFYDVEKACAGIQQ